MSSLAIAAPTALWYSTRGTGAVTLVLMTASVVLGVAGVRRFRLPGLPRFAVDALHRSVSLLALAFLTVHVLTSILDGFAPITLLNAVVPFGERYRPLWLGLGAVALDLMVALTVTSLMRRRMGYGAWRATHWLAYACWPIALVHGLGTGSDTRGRWMLTLTGVCILAVAGAVAVRLIGELRKRPVPAASALTGLLLGGVGLAVWMAGGPLAPGWAKRAGTPVALLASANRTQARAPTSSRVAQGTDLVVPFVTSLSGELRQTNQPDGSIAIEIALNLGGVPQRLLDVRIDGQPDGGGVAMTSSRVALGTSANPNLYQGSIVALNGTRVIADVTSAGGRHASVDLNLQIDRGSGSVTGEATARVA
jgi:sulfoxide reductase heme-binding subunit YedZ